MIAAGLVLLAIGGADLLREFLPARARWIALIAGAVVVLLLAGFSDAVAAGILAIVVAAAWVWLAPVGAPSRAGFWPAVAVGALAAILVAAMPARADAGLIGRVWSFATPVGDVVFDRAVLVVGAALFLLESANVVVRAALVQERVQVGADAPAQDAEQSVPAVISDPPVAVPVEQSPAIAAELSPVEQSPAIAAELSPVEPPADDARAASITPLSAPPALKGGRLIGPLERILVFSLTLALMYPLIAAILAAKGIVRFPEINRDSAAGNRAEYFLIGSLVSWVIALAAAFLVWWAFATTGP